MKWADFDFEHNSKKYLRPEVRGELEFSGMPFLDFFESLIKIDTIQSVEKVNNYFEFNGTFSYGIRICTLEDKFWHCFDTKEDRDAEFDRIRHILCVE